MGSMMWLGGVGQGKGASKQQPLRSLPPPQTKPTNQPTNQTLLSLLSLLAHPNAKLTRHNRDALKGQVGLFVCLHTRLIYVVAALTLCAVCCLHPQHTQTPQTNQHQQGRSQGAPRQCRPCCQQRVKQQRRGSSGSSSWAVGSTAAAGGATHTHHAAGKVGGVVNIKHVCVSGWPGCEFNWCCGVPVAVRFWVEWRVKRACGQGGVEQSAV